MALPPLPLLLAGPIVRRVEPTLASVWVALANLPPSRSSSGKVASPPAAATFSTLSDPTPTIARRRSAAHRRAAHQDSCRPRRVCSSPGRSTPTTSRSRRRPTTHTLQVARPADDRHVRGPARRSARLRGERTAGLRAAAGGDHGPARHLRLVPPRRQRPSSTRWSGSTT